MTKTEEFLKNLRITAIKDKNSSRRLLIATDGRKLSFHISGHITELKRIRAEYAFPDAISEVITNHFGFEVDPDTILDIYNWV